MYDNSFVYQHEDGEGDGGTYMYDDGGGGYPQPSGFEEAPFEADPLPFAEGMPTPGPADAKPKAKRRSRPRPPKRKPAGSRTVVVGVSSSTCLHVTVPAVMQRRNTCSHVSSRSSSRHLGSGLQRQCQHT